MKFRLDFSDGHHIIVQLHECMKPWADHVEKISGKYQYSLNSETSALHDNNFSDDESRKIKHVYDVLLDTAKKLDHVRPMGITLPDTFSHDQDTLNQLHRYYTDSAVSVEKDSELFELVSKVNYCVHELEEFTSDRNTGYASDLWFHVAAHPIPMDCWIDLKTLHDENYKFFDYDYDYTVRLDRSILGKCVLQSFQENDDPTAVDCTGRLGSFGGFFIDVNKNLKQVYQSESFVSWCSKHGKAVRDMPLEFVIGKVDKFSDEPDNYVNKDLLKLTFDPVPSSIG